MLVLLRKRTIGDGKYLRQKIQYFIRLTCAERKSPKNIKRTKGNASKSGNIGKRMSKLSRNICICSRNICAKCSIVVGTFAPNVPKRICVCFICLGSRFTETLLLRGNISRKCSYYGNIWRKCSYYGNISRKCSYYGREALSERREGCFVTLRHAYQKRGYAHSYPIGMPIPIRQECPFLYFGLGQRPGGGGMMSFPLQALLPTNSKRRAFHNARLFFFNLKFQKK